MPSSLCKSRPGLFEIFHDRLELTDVVVGITSSLGMANTRSHSYAKSTVFGWTSSFCLIHTHRPRSFESRISIWPSYERAWAHPPKPTDLSRSYDSNSSEALYDHSCLLPPLPNTPRRPPTKMIRMGSDRCFRVSC